MGLTLHCWKIYQKINNTPFQKAFLQAPFCGWVIRTTTKERLSIVDSAIDFCNW